MVPVYNIMETDMDLLTPNLINNSKIPLYQQLYSYIKHEIQNGKLPYNSKLPSKRKLSSHLNLSQNTIQSAYDQLIEEGYIVSAERKGYYIANIENIIDIKPTAISISAPAEKAKAKARYDFSYQGVDHSSFPFNAWRKLSREVINEYDINFLQATHPQGYLPLRAAISRYLYQSRGVLCNENQIIISSGTEFLLQILIQLFGDETIYGLENPGFEKLSQLFSANKASFVPIELDNHGMLPAAITSEDANIICVTPAHQFPTGNIMPIKRRLQLLKWASEKADRYIIEDDYDSEFKYSGKPIPALQGLDSNQKVVYMGTFSKSLAPTIRISYMVLPSVLLEKYKKLLSYIICPVPFMEQKLLYRFIQDGYFDRHLNKMRTIYKKKRELLVSSLNALNIPIEILGADSGLHLSIEVKNQMNESELVEAAAKKGVTVYPLSRYYSTQVSKSSSPIILLGYATILESEIPQAVYLLGEAWK